MAKSKTISVKCEHCQEAAKVNRPPADQKYPDGMLWICPKCRGANTVKV